MSTGIIPPSRWLPCQRYIECLNGSLQTSLYLNSILNMDCWINDVDLTCWLDLLTWLSCSSCFRCRSVNIMRFVGDSDQNNGWRCRWCREKVPILHTWRSRSKSALPNEDNILWWCVQNMLIYIYIAKLVYKCKINKEMICQHACFVFSNSLTIYPFSTDDVWRLYSFLF